MTLPLSVSDILKEASVFSELTFPLASCLPSCTSPSHLLPKPMLGKACRVSGFQMLGQEGNSPEVPAWQRPETLNHRLPLPLVFELEGVKKQLIQTKVFTFCIQRGSIKTAGGHQDSSSKCSRGSFSGSHSGTGISIHDAQHLRP